MLNSARMSRQKAGKVSSRAPITTTMSPGRAAAAMGAAISARVAKNYAESDRLRDELAARGVEIMDSASGSTWRRKSG